MISLHHFFSYTHPPGPVMTSISVSTTSHRRSQGLQSHGERDFLRLLARWGGAQQSNPQHVFNYVPRCFPVVFYAPGHHPATTWNATASTRERITSYKHTPNCTPYTTLHSLCFSRRSNTQHIPKMKVAWSALCALSLSLPSMAIDTVPSLDVKKYLGRWYQVRGGVRGTSDCCCPSSVLCCVQPPLGLSVRTPHSTFNSTHLVFVRSELGTRVLPALRQRVHIQDHEGHHLYRCRLWFGESTHERCLCARSSHSFMSKIRIFARPARSLVCSASTAVVVLLNTCRFPS